jgi:hypothetical protein
LSEKFSRVVGKPNLAEACFFSHFIHDAGGYFFTPLRPGF